MSEGYRILSLDDVETLQHGGPITVGEALGFRPAGIDARTADTGGDLVPPHSEEAGVEELYVVVRGRATFTVDGEEADAPAGTLVFAPPEAQRAAVAAEDRTLVFVVGGTIGKPFRA